MEKIQIEQARNNRERQQTYRKQLGRYKRAMSNEFYFEAMMIVYSMLEDRLKSILYHCGIFKNRNVTKFNSQVKSDVMNIVYGDNPPTKFGGFGIISNKIEVIEGILKWADTVDSTDICNNGFLIELKNQIESIDIGGMIETLDALRYQDNNWLGYRNEIIHASLNKNIDALYENLKEHVERGMEYARFIDSQDRILRDKGRVRKYLRLQNN